MSAVLERAPPRQSARFETAVVVTRKTRLEELVARFNTVAQARFYLEHAGQEFAPIAEAHARYHAALDAVRGSLTERLRQQVIDRSLLGQVRISETDLVITVGPDGLVANTARFAAAQPIIAVNPDPQLYDGPLLAFTARSFPRALQHTLRATAAIHQVAMAEARLDDGQTLLGFNDLFIGAQSHVSARYRIAQGDTAEDQSSSGIIVSTGAGSTGWLQSVYAGAAGVVEALGGQVVAPPQGGRIPWDTNYLVYAVREPFPSGTTRTGIVYGVITPAQPLRLTSYMSDGGVVFSDGVERDRLAFNAGARATVTLAAQKANLVVQ